MPDKKVRLTLVGLDVNAFALMGAFRRAALDQGWSQKEVREVLDDAMSGDYDHLLRVLISNCEDEDDE